MLDQRRGEVFEHRLAMGGGAAEAAMAHPVTHNPNSNPVIPAKAGVQVTATILLPLGSRFRGNDGQRRIQANDSAA